VVGHELIGDWLDCARIDRSLGTQSIIAGM
jgi:hypothetical protein